MDKRVVTTYVALDEERRRMTREALADVEARRTHAHAKIEAWAKSLRKPKRKARG